MSQNQLNMFCCYRKPVTWPSGRSRSTTTNVYVFLIYLRLRTLADNLLSGQAWYVIPSSPERDRGVTPLVVYVAKRENVIVNRLNKTKVEREVDHEQERVDRVKKENAEKRAAAAQKVRVLLYYGAHPLRC